MSEAILDRLPHREPFRFVSGVDHVERGRRGVAHWNVSGNETFFAGHFPGDPVLPGVLIAEALAQLSGLVAFAGGDAGVAARLAQVNVKFRSSVVPPADIRLESTLGRELDGLFLFDVRAVVDGAEVAVGTLVLARVS